MSAVEAILSQQSFYDIAHTPLRTTSAFSFANRSRASSFVSVSPSLSLDSLSSVSAGDKASTMNDVDAILVGEHDSKFYFEDQHVTFSVRGRIPI
jgi:predicted nucleotide-binding protein (sugar kinase/HSP70/actin superfamily)